MMEFQMDEPLSQPNFDSESSILDNYPDTHVELLMDDLDSTFDEFNTGLIISRMVGDSIFKGALTAISDEYDEKLASKEKEIKYLAEELQSHKTEVDNLTQKLQNYEQVHSSSACSELQDLELQKKWCDELTVIKDELGDILEFCSSSELGAHIANSGANFKVAVPYSEERVDEIFSGLLHLDDMKREDLMSYFKEEITKMKREHDMLLQQKTEEVFVLKRELLKEKGSSNPLQSEILRKRISKLVTELEGVLTEKESSATHVSENHNHSSLINEQQVKILALDEENQQLRNAVAEKEKDWKAKTLFYLRFEEDILIESEIREEVKNIVLKEMFEEFESKIQIDISNVESRKDKEVCIEKEEKEKLKQLVDFLSKQAEAKDKFTSEVENKFMLLSSKFDLFKKQFNKLEEKVKEQDLYILNSNGELNALSSKLELILVKVQEHEVDFSQLKHNLENTSGDVEKEKEKEKEVLESVMVSVEKMLEMVEWRLINNVDCCASRILLMKSQFDQLVKEAKFLKHEKEWYKKASEVKSANLRTAEKEVDLLGDEVDVLTYLLEKVFRVLNHYSYVFQHYPGVIEVLKLIDNYMKGEPIRIVRPQSQPNGLLTP
ncbi:Myosin heavy chain-like protein [Rhynchospora pubera]|uniref:Myosin heavy chain-like protein n=1 Tax=Rhynchospora pubera TaxID=906938 RepID=A0AAV8HEX0_9POAL|nr:Myosin heavy chain-like protein [Rhynchospora pubera]